MCDKVAKAAAEWWIEQMKKRCTTLYPNRIIKDRTGFVITDNILGEELSRFQKNLTNELRNKLLKARFVYLGCSYTPDSMLLDIAKQSKIPISYFPIHADMEIHHMSIRVSSGESDLHELHFST